MGNKPTSIQPNIDPETGIRYGIGVINKLSGDLLSFLTPEYLCEFGKCPYKDECENPGDPECLDELCSNCEPAFWKDKDYTFIFTDNGYFFLVKSPVTDTFRLCSPCFPNAVDLDSSDPDGCEGYCLEKGDYDNE